MCVLCQLYGDEQCKRRRNLLYRSQCMYLVTLCYVIILFLYLCLIQFSCIQPGDESDGRLSWHFTCDTAQVYIHAAYIDYTGQSLCVVCISSACVVQSMIEISPFCLFIFFLCSQELSDWGISFERGISGRQSLLCLIIMIFDDGKNAPVCRIVV